MFKRKGREAPPRRRAAATQLEEEALKFRRSATLTGSLSDDVRASVEERGQLQTARMEAQVKRKKQRRLMRRLTVAGVVLGVLCIAYLHHTSSFAISYQGDLAAVPSSGPYVTSGKQFASSSFRNQFGLTMDRQKFAQYIMQHHKEVAVVQVTPGLFSKRPKVTLTLRKPVLLWQTTHDPQGFYVDNQGVAFSFNAYKDDGQLVRVNDESGVPAELGVPVASSRQISFLGQLVGQVHGASKGALRITKIVFPPSSTKEIHVYLKDRPYFIKVYLERSAKAQAEEIVKGISYLDQKGVKPGQYLDVRVAERVFYK